MEEIADELRQAAAEDDEMEAVQRDPRGRVDYAEGGDCDKLQR